MCCFIVYLHYWLDNFPVHNTQYLTCILYFVLTLDLCSLASFLLHFILNQKKDDNHMKQQLFICICFNRHLVFVYILLKVY